MKGLWKWLAVDRHSLWLDTQPIRSEPFGGERLEQHARSLAAAQPIGRLTSNSNVLRSRLRDNERVLLEAYRSIADAVLQKRSVTPAAEWLLDNYHIVEQQIRQVRADLPPGYYRQLPKLADGFLAGYPRVFGVVWAYVAHTDSRFEPQTLRAFLQAYQSVEALTIGELWAVAITLRILLIENLRRLAELIVIARHDRDAADLLMDRLLPAGDRAAEPDAWRAYDDKPLSSGFAVELVHRLRDHDPAEMPAVRWLADRLSRDGLNSDELVANELHVQGTSNVTVRNIITSMRLISDIDWSMLVEAVSPVDAVLRGNPFYPALDFTTRNLYRTAVEQLGRQVDVAEVDVARLAVSLSQEPPATGADAPAGRQLEPGYWLIGPGRAAFERRLGVEPRWSWRRSVHGTSLGGYLAMIGVVASIFLAFALSGLRDAGMGDATLALMVGFGVLVSIEAALAIVNAFVTSLGATRLPSLDLQDGVPDELRTLVAVPSLLSSAAAIDELAERLQVHYLANPRGAIHFALLTDWLDAKAAIEPGDEALLEHAREAVARLNRLYPAAGPAAPRFLLLHRARRWNEAQGCWMGWERKRGKLHELNRLLRGATDTSFLDETEVPGGVRYVVTLDSDTRLPRDTVQRLVGKMAHPLNRPVLDATRRRVIDGYGILQPRVAPSLPREATGSIFQRVFSANSGIDPYASAISDVYQDLFGEGSYTGKGIYDVDAFEFALAGRAPDNTLLSHDLFEGSFARAGLASDIEVVEDYPTRYDVASARQHRWARGDWQLLPWILDGRAQGAQQLPPLARWKMIDNLRRSLMAPAALAALAAGWLLPLEGAVVWTLFVLLVISIPTLLPLGAALEPRHAGVPMSAHLRAFGIELRNAVVQTGLLVIFLPQQAWLMGDAIVRTLHRVFVSRRRLLDWTTAQQEQARLRFDLASYHRQMVGGLALTVVVSSLAWSASFRTLIVAMPFIAVWLLAPTIAYLISLPRGRAARRDAAKGDAERLRQIARRTWRFFETFVTAGDNHLPPDNFQEDPHPVVAHRTSPTNMGLYLLAVVSANDFGWIGRREAIERLEATLATMERLPRHRGHFFNWYDTQSLAVLQPAYVSSVDSGNLAGHLLALAHVLAAWRDGEASADLAPAAAGTRDALQLARSDLAREKADGLDDARAGIRRALDGLGRQPASLDDIAARLEGLARFAGESLPGDAGYWVDAAVRTVRSHRRDHDEDAAADRRDGLLRRLGNLEAAARDMALAMDFGFLFDDERLFLSIGYAAVEDKLDPGHYDLLASEARLASLVAIAKGDVPTRHWFRLGRELTAVGSGAALVSWSGSMFEYLMPSLVMRAPPRSLLHDSNERVVERQRRFAKALGVPWGISEAAYNARDTALNYQYSNFGVPGLGFKRGLSENLVVAPYATALAAMVDPRESVANFARLESMGALGPYGFYESIDFTPTRLPENARFAVVRTWMAHHQGMTIVALANTLFDGVMRSRFHGEPLIQAAELLLEEQAPREVSVSHPRAEEVGVAASPEGLEPPVVRRVHNPHAPGPSVHLLSNGRFSTMLTAAGSGYSRCNELAVTRWREDATRDDWGSYLYLRDARGRVWSPTWQPTGTQPDGYEVAFAEDRAEFHRRDGTLVTTLDILVSPEANGEARRLSIHNEGHETVEIEVTSYAELVLATAAADTAHQAFSKMFVQTEFLPPAALLATRRRRAPDEPEVWCAHVVVGDALAFGDVQYETDRARFLGRGNGVEDADAVYDGKALSNTVGRVLDPVFALRRRVRVPAGGVARLTFWTMMASSREALIELVYRHQDDAGFERAAMLAWTQAQVQMRHLGISSPEASLFQRTAGHVLYANPAMRASRDVIRQGMAPANRLWPQSISGDLPIVLVRIADAEEIGLVREMLRAFEYWRLKGLAVDLVILNERGTSYIQDLQAAIEALVRSASSATHLGAATAGKVFTLRADLVSAETRALLLAASRVVLIGRRGSLGEQLNRVRTPRGLIPPRRRRPPHEEGAQQRGRLSALGALRFFNGTGGFSPNGREYVTVLGPGRTTPAPWINVVSGTGFGFQVAADGGGYTWSRNSRDNQLTPWSNDPVSDRPGEIFYLRDLDDGTLWTPTASPIRLPGAAYLARHGWGYSRFELMARGLSIDLLQFVPLEESVKVSRLVVRNLSGRSRRLSVTAYVEWVLGLSRGIAAATVVTDSDLATQAILARNPWNADHGARVAFLDLGGRQRHWTADRSEFIGRNCTAANPAALSGTIPLSGRVGGGLDPCGALQAELELDSGQATELICLLGQSDDAAGARDAIERWRGADLDRALREVTAFWSDTVGAVQVRTPDAALDLMLNGWLLYQTLACRYWARSAFYQASGAYGFRDQLQDVMAFTATRPDLTRAQILRAAARQFVEGDVQHWWFEPSGRGVRTRISDDLIWLAYVTAHYIETTADAAILDEQIAFLEGPLLQPSDHDLYFEPEVAEERASLFEHCARALDRSLAVGRHGLPLIGTGDWNDGMNRVGEKGQGESVWLGWFLCATLDAFLPHARQRDRGRARRWQAHGRRLRAALDADGWDGAWYRRGFYDDGTPLGSSVNDECRIDSIAQSWAALSGAGDAARARQAMQAFEEHLLRRKEGLSLLFTPPFDRSAQEPGYIKGYPPGIRENGGQYTHAAAWAIMAHAALGQADKAVELLSLVNPINHAASEEQVRRYKVEPYVVAADVYSVAPHAGRGGWTWYTGSAGWLHRAGLESILGIRRRGDMLIVAPCIPGDWPGFEASLALDGTTYVIRVANERGAGRGVTKVGIDGVARESSNGAAHIPLEPQAGRREIEIVLG